MAGHRAVGKDGGASALTISGMTCASCVNTVTLALSSVPDIGSGKVDLAIGRAFVTGTALAEALIAAVQVAGYSAQIATGGTAEGERDERRGSSCC